LFSFFNLIIFFVNISLTTVGLKRKKQGGEICET